jgi:hypothetical protein
MSAFWMLRKRIRYAPHRWAIDGEVREHVEIDGQDTGMIRDHGDGFINWLAGLSDASLDSIVADLRAEEQALRAAKRRRASYDSAQL